jgi:GTP cyclohydrolase IB
LVLAEATAVWFLAVYETLPACGRVTQRFYSLWSIMKIEQLADFCSMPDVQASPDHRRVVIQRVGVKRVRYPVTVQTPSGTQSSVGLYDLDVLLPANKKGTHMSRFIELLEEQTAALSLLSLRQMLRLILSKLDADAGRIAVSFPYFIKKTAPVSKVQSLLDYQVWMVGELKRGVCVLWLKVRVPVTSLCPCSKEIARYGAHNQRSYVTMDLELAQDMTIEEVVRVAEDEASCELWGLLKRQDEKYVTEYAYENPKFVEDLVRNIALRFDAEPRVRHYIVEAENFESIHNHSAYALIDSKQRAAEE